MLISFSEVRCTEAVSLTGTWFARPAARLRRRFAARWGGSDSRRSRSKRPGNRRSPAGAPPDPAAAPGSSGTGRAEITGHQNNAAMCIEMTSSYIVQKPTDATSDPMCSGKIRAARCRTRTTLQGLHVERSSDKTVGEKRGRGQRHSRFKFLFGGNIQLQQLSSQPGAI